MTAAVRPDVRDFFERYARAGDTLDTDALNDCFGETFLNLDPTTAVPVSREALIRALPMRDRLFASIGAQGLDLTSLAETPLDELHTLVESVWSARFGPDAANAEPLTLTAAFLLRRDGDRWRIVVYLNHHDVGAVIRERERANQG